MEFRERELEGRRGWVEEREGGNDGAMRSTSAPRASYFGPHGRPPRSLHVFFTFPLRFLAKYFILFFIYATTGNITDPILFLSFYFDERNVIEKKERKGILRFSRH